VTLRGAYVELNFVHGEIQPTFAWIANKLGIELDFYLLRENANLRPLATVAGHPKITEIVVPNPHEPCRTPLPDRGFGGRMDLDGVQLQRALTHANVREFATITPHELTFPELYGAVVAADFVLPLIDDCYVHTRRYIETKASGAFNVGLGAGLVPILNDTFASAVGINIGPRYRLDDVASGLAAALSTDAPGLARQAVKQWCDRRLEHAARSFGTWLERVT